MLFILCFGKVMNYIAIPNQNPTNFQEDYYFEHRVCMFSSWKLIMFRMQIIVIMS